jgi:hypothetical protein
MDEMDLDQMADDIFEQDKPKIIDKRPNSSLLTFDPVESILIPYKNEDLNVKEIMLGRTELKTSEWSKMYKQTQIYKDKQRAYRKDRYQSDPSVREYYKNYQAERYRAKQINKLKERNDIL